jgi:hypothetical protein
MIVSVSPQTKALIAHILLINDLREKPYDLLSCIEFQFSDWEIVIATPCYITFQFKVGNLWFAHHQSKQQN